MTLWKFYAPFYNKLNALFPYQQLKASVLEYINIKDGGLYLDLGCGTGNLVRGKHNIVGVDISESMLAVANRENRDSRFVCADLNLSLPFNDHSFNGAYSSNVLAYLKDPQSVLCELHRVLKPGSRLVLATLRTSFNPLAILWCHVRQASMAEALSNILFVFVILILNLPIIYRLRKRIYHGFEIDSLRKLLECNGYRVISQELAYADQDVLLVAVRS